MDLKLDSFIKDKTLVFTVTSNGYKYLTWNMWKHIEQLGVSWKLCILCLDRDSYDFFQRIALIPSRLFLLEGGRIDHTQPTLFGTPPFKRMNLMKLKALETLSQHTGVETLLYLDSDIAIFQDPIPDIRAQLLESPLWFQCDEKKEGDFTCSSGTIGSCSNPCSGVIAMRLTDETRPQFKLLYSYDAEGWRAAIGDQDYIQGRFSKTTLQVRTLSREHYPNGIFLANDRFRDKNPVLLHFNYFVGNDKKRVMKSKKCWLLDI